MINRPPKTFHFCQQAAFCSSKCVHRCVSCCTYFCPQHAANSTAWGTFVVGSEGQSSPYTSWEDFRFSIPFDVWQNLVCRRCSHTENLLTSWEELIENFSWALKYIPEWEKEARAKAWQVYKTQKGLDQAGYMKKNKRAKMLFQITGDYLELEPEKDFIPTPHEMGEWVSYFQTVKI